MSEWVGQSVSMSVYRSVIQSDCQSVSSQPVTHSTIQLVCQSVSVGVCICMSALMYVCLYACIFLEREVVIYHCTTTQNLTQLAVYNTTLKTSTEIVFNASVSLYATFQCIVLSENSFDALHLSCIKTLFVIWF